MTRRWKILGLCFLMIASSACRGRDEQGSSSPALADQAVEVEVATVAERTFDRQIEIVGTLAADEEVVVSTEVEGQIVEMRVDLGSVVRRGDVLARLESRDFELRLAEAEAALQQVRARLGLTPDRDRIDPEETAIVRQARAAYEDARLRFQRIRQLHGRGIVSQQELDQADAALRIAEARYEAAVEEVRSLLAQLDQWRARVAAARRDLERTVIRAPISGAVAARHVSLGEFLRRNDRVVTLVKIDPLRLRADVPERYAGKIALGRRLAFVVDAVPEKTFQGMIVRISPSARSETRSLTIEAEVRNPDGELRPGYFARAQLVIEPGAKAIVIPSRAVISSVGLTKVFVLDGDRARERSIKTGARVNTDVEVLEGLRSNERVIVSNLDRLGDGTRVRVARSR
ncbi:MAG: efflux RND transporter periplasmic adaptor subunit [Blastocatellia bacterium]|nr:efflux RND transporter periplasmic adaptor subunit [Blastocatellia bacterium]MCS7158456.1 efflux RND transporter periplasmic adaptor subunit [Blastocatellia bacterium]MCX7753472.1 efflux RND transporter periplasmic adaptor subunit [Blastocatellia bacterium]MDW8167863.1 efflux RND transporter periplasmic adaptor subunit [Acidobacteriota bacterium]MDW8255897.1 efflux RND transporter periplasmic adaptor subunit [Acidobacteriota bacterium]